MYKRPGGSEYEQLPHILDEILNRLDLLTTRLENLENASVCEPISVWYCDENVEISRQDGASN